MDCYKIVFLLVGLIICSASANTDTDIKPKFFRLEQKIHDVNAQLKEISEEIQELITNDFPSPTIQSKWNRVKEEYERVSDELNIILFRFSQSLEWETLVKLGKELGKNFINTRNAFNNYLKKHAID